MLKSRVALTLPNAGDPPCWMPVQIVYVRYTFLSRSARVNRIALGNTATAVDGITNDEQFLAASARPYFSRRFRASSAHAGLVFANHYRHHRDGRRHGHRQFHRARPGRPALHVRRTFLRPDEAISFLLLRSDQTSQRFGRAAGSPQGVARAKHKARSGRVPRLGRSANNLGTGPLRDRPRTGSRQSHFTTVGCSAHGFLPLHRLVRKRASRPGSGCPTRARRNASRRTLCRMGDAIMQ